MQKAFKVTCRNGMINELVVTLPYDVGFGIMIHMKMLERDVKSEISSDANKLRRLGIIQGMVIALERMNVLTKEESSALTEDAEWVYLGFSPPKFEEVEIDTI